ncbi:hypothetical protein GGD68_005924 [Paraburkholderia fungorum]|uniref:Uncharacterized protein n=1 Tax=Paraburkholderia fungorum TaxID=134537 RepID=A0AAW3V2T6_9BURK|nr:hypothetical protein [Paraburkholderia fungorum]MBB6205249.1 hypothetical protein [Paraburkholderia fungorum]
MPIANSTRHAYSAGIHENTAINSSVDTPQPIAQPACTRPTALPRSRGRITSPISTAPAVHSPPKPSPINPRAHSNCEKFCASAHASVNTANQRIVICKVFTRPMRSDSTPAAQPPTAELNSVTVPMSPASPRVMPHVAISVGITKLRNCVSMASST